MVAALPEVRAKARRMYKAGIPVKRIVEELHVAYSSVYLWCKDLIKANKERVRTLYVDQRMTVCDIQKDVGISMTIVKAMVTELRKAEGIFLPFKRTRKIDTTPAEHPFTDYYVSYFTSADGRKWVKLVNQKTRKTHAYLLHRYRMCVKLGRKLTQKELVEFVDPRAEDLYHIDNLRYIPAKQVPHKTCPICRKSFSPKTITQKFCSHSCAGEAKVQKKGPTGYPKVCCICKQDFRAKSPSGDICFSKDCRETLRVGLNRIN